MTQITCTIHGHSVVEPRFLDCPWCLESTITSQSAALKMAVEAMDKANFWMYDPDENANDEFERIGERYASATGFLRPGKDDPFRDSSSSENTMRFRQWANAESRSRHQELIAALTACREALGEQP